MAKWNEKHRPVCLEKRFEFADYESTRDFLDRLGLHSEKVNRFPDISFGKTYVNITIRPILETNTVISDSDRDFAKEIDLLISK